MASSLSPNTIPYELAERIVHELDNSDWKAAYQETFEQISLFEGMLKDRQYIEIVRLATVEEVRSGNVYIASPYKTQPEPPLMLEMQRPELVMACHEHLLRKAEKIGYDGIHKETNRRIIQKLIKELQR